MQRVLFPFSAKACPTFRDSDVLPTPPFSDEKQITLMIIITLVFNDKLQFGTQPWGGAYKPIAPRKSNPNF